MRPLREHLRRFVLPPADEHPLVSAAPPVPLREIFRRFWPYVRPYRRWLLATLVFVAVAPAIQTAEIALFKIVVDRVLVPRDFGPFLWIALAFAALNVAGGAFSFAEDYLSAWLGERFVLSLRTDVFRHVQGLSLDFFERRRLGDVLARLTGDVSAIESLVLAGVADALSYGLRIVFFGGALFYLSWELALVSLVVAPLFLLTARRFSRSIKRASREKRRRSGSISAVAEESLANAALVQAYGRQETEVGRFRREGLGSLEAELAATRLRALFAPVVDLIDLTGAMIVIGLGTWQLAAGRLSVGGLLAFMAFLSQLYSPIRGLARLSNTVYSASAGAERVIELLEHQPAVRERPDALRLPRSSGLVSFEGVGFSYPGARRDALEGVSFRAGPGETLALVGPSGAGKTTAARLLLRFHDPARGRIRIDGHDLRALRLDSLRANIAAVFQETLVFHGTVRENIAYGRAAAGDEEIVRAALDADAHDFILGLPDGYDTVVGERGRRLSGGQRQRIAIARAMLRRAPILLLDEPTTGLDGDSSDRILGPLRRLMDGRTTIVISHDLLTVRDATWIVVLDAGRVVEEGTHPDLLARDGSYARLYRLRRLEPALAPVA